MRGALNYMTPIDAIVPWLRSMDTSVIRVCSWEVVQAKFCLEVGVWVPIGSEMSIPWVGWKQRVGVGMLSDNQPAIQPTMHTTPWYRQTFVAESCAHGNLLSDKRANKIKRHILVKGQGIVCWRHLQHEHRSTRLVDFNDCLAYRQLLGHLNLKMYDGFFFTHNITYDQLQIDNNESKDVSFCATRKSFNLTVNFLSQSANHPTFLLDKRRTSDFTGGELYLLRQFQCLEHHR